MQNIKQLSYYYNNKINSILEEIDNYNTIIVMSGITIINKKQDICFNCGEERGLSGDAYRCLACILLHIIRGIDFGVDVSLCNCMPGLCKANRSYFDSLGYINYPVIPKFRNLKTYEKYVLLLIKMIHYLDNKTILLAITKSKVSTIERYLHQF